MLVEPINRAGAILVRSKFPAALYNSCGMETVFHRAFDVVCDADAALDALIAVGVTRVLTSGRAPTSLAGASVIRRAIERS